MNICYPVETEQGTVNTLHGNFRLAPRFVIYNTETNEKRVLENQLQKKAHNIEIPVKSLRAFQVEATIVGGIAKCDLAKLNNHGIKVFQAQELSLEKNMEAFFDGELIELTQKNTHRGFPCQ